MTTPGHEHSLAPDLGGAEFIRHIALVVGAATAGAVRTWSDIAAILPG